MKKLIYSVFLVLVCGITITGCDNGTTKGSTAGLNGTWYSGNVLKCIFSDGNFEFYQNGKPYEKGTYTTTDNTIDIIVTYVGGFLITWQDSSTTWYTEDEYKQAFTSYWRNYYSVLGNYYSASEIDFMVNDSMNQMETIWNNYFTTRSIRYSFLDGGKLALIGYPVLTRE